MCTMVFLGSDQPFDFGPPTREGAVAPAPLSFDVPALSGCRHLAQLVDWKDGRPVCSCVFMEGSVPWEPKPEMQETVAAFDALRAIAAVHGSGLRIFGCDDVDANLLPKLRCRLAPDHIRAGMILFSIPFQGGASPRVLIEIVPGLLNPEKPETLGVL